MQSFSNQAHPVKTSLLLILCAVYLLTGLLDHNLWKYEDAVHVGVAWDMAHGGSWLHPHLAGETWHFPPLYYWLASILGQLLGPLFGFHNAARLATTVFGALLLFALGRASAINLASQRHQPYTQPGRFDAAAPLLILGAPGLLLPIHEAQPMIAVLAGQALVYWGLAQLPQTTRGGIPLALGLSIATLAGGLHALLPLAPLLLLPLLSSAWREPSSWRGGVIGIAITAAVIGTYIWLREANLAPLRLQTSNAFSSNHFELLSWFTWPMLPIALWSIWVHRRRLSAPHVLLPLLGSIGSVLLFLMYSEARILPAVPILLPLTLLAASGAGRMRRGAANALDWFGMMAFTLTAALVWLGAVALVFGVPPKVTHNFMRLTPGFTPELSWGWLIGVLISILWIAIIFRSRRSPWRATTHWACGVMLLWGLCASLLMPWIDYGKNYTSVANKVAAAVGQFDADKQCIAGQNVGDAQRASLDYYAKLRIENNTDKRCSWLLVQGKPHALPTPGDGWRKVWEGARPGDRAERYYLFKR